MLEKQLAREAYIAKIKQQLDELEGRIQCRTAVTAYPVQDPSITPMVNPTTFIQINTWKSPPPWWGRESCA